MGWTRFLVVGAALAVVAVSSTWAGEAVRSGATVGTATSSTGTWVRLPTPPITPRLHPALVGVGSRFYVLGGVSEGSSGGFRTMRNGAVFDVRTRTWRAISGSSRAVGLAYPAAAWNGDAVVMVGTRCPDRKAPDDGSDAEECPGGRLHAVAYYPERGWRSIDVPGGEAFQAGGEPEDVRAFALGESVVVRLSRRTPGSPRTVTHSWLLLDRDRVWSVLPSPPGADVDACGSTAEIASLSQEAASTSAIPGQPLIAGPAVAEARVSTLDERTRTWTPISDPAPLPPSGQYRVACAEHHVVVAPLSTTTSGAQFDPSRRSWSALPPVQGALVAETGLVPLVLTPQVGVGDRVLWWPTSYPPRAGLLYDITDETWRALPKSPNSTQAVAAANSVLALAGAPPSASGTTATRYWLLTLGPVHRRSG